MIPASNSKNVSRVEILAKYRQFKPEHPKARARDIASRLNISEAELLGRINNQA